MFGVVVILLERFRRRIVTEIPKHFQMGLATVAVPAPIVQPICAVSSGKLNNYCGVR